MYQQQRIISSDYQIVDEDEYTVILVYALTGNINIYLPYATNFDKVIILKADNTLNEVFVHLKGNDTFQGSKAAYRLRNPYQLVEFTTDNESAWYAVSTYTSGSASSVGGSGGVSVHSDLSGLLANDHPQYLHVSGSNPIASNLDMRGFSIYDVLNINDVNILTLTSSIDGHILDTNNPHATTFSNLDPGTLSELNSVLIDANLDDSGSARTPTAHSASHLSGGSDSISIQQLEARGVTEGHLFAAGPDGNIITFASSAFAQNDHGTLQGLGDLDHPQYETTASFRPYSASIKTFTASVLGFSSSYSSRISNLEAQSGSLTSSISTLFDSSASFRADIGDLQVSSASFSSRVTNLESASSSFVTQINELYAASASFDNASASYASFSASFVIYSASWSSISGGGGSTDISALNSHSASVQTFTSSVQAFSASVQGQTASIQVFSSSILAASASWESDIVSQTASIVRLDNASASYAGFSASFVEYSASWSAGTTDISALNSFSASIQEQTASIQVFSASMLAASGAFATISSSYKSFSASHASNHLSGGIDQINAQDLGADGLGANRLLMTNPNGGWTTVPSSSVGAGGGATDITALNEHSQSVQSFSASMQEFTASIQAQTASIQTFSASILAASSSWENELALQTSSIVRLDNASASFVLHSASWDNDLSSIKQHTSSMNQFSASIDFSASFGSIQTGLLEGGILSISASSFVNVSSGSGLIVTYQNNFRDYQVQTVHWPSISGVALVALTSSDFTVLGIDSNSQVVQLGGRTPTPEERKDYIWLGRASHANNATISFFIQNPIAAKGLDAAITDHIISQGTYNINGNNYYNSGSNLSLSKTSGEIFRPFVNARTNLKNIHIVSLSASNPITSFNYRYRTGSLGDYAEFSTSSIDPNRYELDGNLASVPSNRWTIQRIRTSTIGLTIVQYGQRLYNSLAEAIDGIADTTVEDDALNETVLRAKLIVRGSTTNLSDATNNKFIEITSEGGVGAGATVTDHGLLSGLGDLDHPQYETTASFRPFSSAVQLFTASIQTFSASTLAASGAFATISSSYKEFSASFVGYSASWSSITPTDIAALNSFSQSIQTQTASIQVFSASILLASASWESSLASQTASIVRLDNASASYAAFSASFVEYSASWSSITPTDITALNSFSASTQAFTASIQAQTASVQTFSASMLAASASWTGVSQSYNGFSASHAVRHLSGGADPIDAQNLRANAVPVNHLLISNANGGWTTVASSSVGGSGGGGSTDISALNAFTSSAEKIIRLKSIRGFTENNFLTVGAQSDLNGPNSSGSFEILAIIIPNYITGITSGLNTVISTMDGQFFGPGFELGFNGTRPRFNISSGSADRVENFIGNWSSGVTQPKPLFIGSFSFDATNNLASLKNCGKTIASRAVVTYESSSIGMTIGRRAGAGSASDLFTEGSVVAVAAKTNGTISESEYNDIVRKFLSEGVLSGSFTSLWEFYDIPVGSLTGTIISDKIGSNDLHVSGTLTVGYDNYFGAAMTEIS